jgi:class 3 adenylate cyclase
MFLTLLLASALLVGGWLASDRALGWLPPPSLLVKAGLKRWPEASARLPHGLLGPVPLEWDASKLPAWRQPPAVERQVTHRVSDITALAQAMAHAQPGDVIEVAAGEHRVVSTLLSGGAGRSDAPIVLRGAPGARLASSTAEAIKLRHPHWVVEHFDLEGVCSPPERCEHALHVVGEARHVVNAAVKVNGENGAWPDHGTLRHSLLLNESPRPGTAPATPFDLVGASHWRVHDNRVLGVAKAGGNGVAYGLFMKGGGSEGRFERNLVVCATTAAFVGVGAQVGISFGGGQTHPSVHRDPKIGFEHLQGLAAENQVFNCNDTSLDVNQSAGIELRDNLLLGGGGILVRGQHASAHAVGNTSSAAWYARRGNGLTGSSNQRWTPTTQDAASALGQRPTSP